MTLSNVFIAAIFASASMEPVLAHGATTTLRRNGDATDQASTHRKLPLAITMNQIVQVFTPVLGAAISTALDGSLDPLPMDLTFTQTVDNVVFGGTCTSSATVTYTVRELSGLGGFVLDNMPIVAGSPRLDISIFRGITWSAAFNVDGSFPEGLQTAVDVAIAADACGVAVQESASGVVNAVDANLLMRVGASGSAPGVLTLASSSATASVAGDAKLNFGPLATDLAFDNGEIQINLPGLIGDAVFNTAEFSQQIVDLIVGTLNTALASLSF